MCACRGTLSLFISGRRRNSWASSRCVSLRSLAEHTLRAQLVVGDTLLLRLLVQGFEPSELGERALRLVRLLEPRVGQEELVVGGRVGRVFGDDALQAQGGL